MIQSRDEAVKESAGSGQRESSEQLTCSEATNGKAVATATPAHPDLRSLPGVGELAGDPDVQNAASGLAPEHVTAAIRRVIDAERARLQRDGGSADRAAILAAVRDALQRLAAPRLVPVLNATGVILHTNLGRAPVSAAAAAAMHAAAAAYVPLELDLDRGERGGRMDELAALFRALTGCEDALVVNNNAAATTLVLAAVVGAERRDVFVSRAEAVEIGGSFRIPDILRQSGATLVDVGTTNRTYFRDYEAALSPTTAAILKVHTSNFRLTGFVHTTPSAELVPLGDRHGVPVIDDLGSGALVDTRDFGLAAEPTLQASVAAGAHLICASGDKLLGGPQAGIVLGRREWVARCAAHPLARAFRADKATLAGLAATLRHYLRIEYVEHIPIWRMIAAAPGDLRSRCDRWVGALEMLEFRWETTPTRAAVGGGSLPGEELPSFAATITADALRAAGIPLDSLARALRVGSPGVVGRVEQDRLWLDARTVLPEDDGALIEAVRAALHACAPDRGQARGD